MASKSSMAIRTNAAMLTIKSAIHDLFGEDFELPQHYRDLEMLSVLQWEAIATYLDCKARGANIKSEIDLDNVPIGTTVSVPMMSIVGESLSQQSITTTGNAIKSSRKPRTAKK